MDAIKNDYTYYADGSPKYMQNLLDERVDRAYGYDHRGMMKEAFSGSEARDFVNNTSTPGATGPYWQIYQHDAFGNMTQRDNRFWTQSDVYTASYSNHRRTETGYQYDADGNLLQDPDVTFGHDAAGNNVFLSSPNGTAYTTTFDGDGQLVKKVHTFSGSTVFVKYSLRSSVLGGRIVTEISGQGQKLSTYVFAGGQLLARQQGGAVAWEHRDPLSGSQVDSFADGAFGPINQLDPMGLDVGFQDPFTPCCDPPPTPSDSGTLLPMWGDGIPNGRCTLDGISIDCGWAFQMMNSGSAVQCPNNDCGPRVMNSYDRNGYFLGHVLSQAFQAFADGFSGFLPPGARYQGGGMWSIPSAATRQSTPPSLKPAASSVNRVGNRDPYGIGYNEGATTGTSGATPQNRNAINYGPVTQADFDRAVPLVEKNYDKCVKLFSSGDSETPRSNSSGLALAVAQNNADDAAMIGAIWMHESGTSGGINATEYWGDAGPAQLTFSGVRDNPTLGPLVVGDAYGNWRGRISEKEGDPPWRGNEQDNLATLRNLVRFGRLEYGGNWKTAYWYGPGYPDAPGSQRARDERTKYANNISRIYNKYLQFFKCLGGN